MEVWAGATRLWRRRRGHHGRYGSDPNNKYITTYFRKTFTVSNPSQFNGLTLDLLRDDGAVIYVNGQEVARSNMPTGTINYQTLAATNIGGADETTNFYTYTLNPSILLSEPIPSPSRFINLGELAAISASIYD